ncbi:hypothetical protein [Priestia megaterium]|uniref:hypothetical protein n=1 Tax=Priestia megaterium TaxID=1404 RepID=UPI0031FBB3C7
MSSALVEIPMRVAASKVKEEEAQATLDLINRHTMEPFRSMDELFPFSGICSNDRMDSYMTKMDPYTTLRNYAANLKDGVSLMNGHDISQIPYGRSYDGEVITDSEQELTSVRGFWYIPKDTEVNGVNTNQSIRAIKTGIQRDMSVGFGGDNMYYRCSSCGKDLFDWECEHFPGMMDERGEMTFAWIVDASLREVSTVYKASCPGAYIEKARAFYGQGQLEQSYITKLENTYSIRLDDGKGKRSFYLPKRQQTKEEQNMGAQARNSLLDDIRSAIRENKIEKAVVYDILAEEGDPFRQPEDIQLRNELGKDYCSTQAIRQLKREAQQGRRYLADVIDSAVASRVKAQGDTFNADSYRQMLTLSGDIDHIKDEIDSYERLAKQRFVGGRQTQDDQLPSDDDNRSEDNSFKIDPDKDNFFEEGDE